MSVHPAPPAQDLDAPESPLVFPCSSSQQRCWIVDATSPGTTALNIALRWELRGPFTAALVEEAFQTVVDRQEALRTRIVERDGIPFQEVAPAYPFRLSEIDLTIVQASQRQAEAERLGALEAHRPFDPSRLPLFRVTLLRLAPDRGILLVTVHQIAFDGWSIRLFSREFGTILAALEAGRLHGLPDLPMQYGDFAAWQEVALAETNLQPHAAYWRRQLAGAPYFEIPSDRPRPPVPTHNGAILAAFLPGDFGDRMAAAARNGGVTLFALGCAAIGATLHRLTGATDICVGTQIAGRDDPDLEPIIGVFINNLVLRLELSGDPRFSDALQRVSRTVQDGLAHQRMPFHKLVTALNPARDPRRLPLISVNFTVLQDVMDDASYGPFTLKGHPSLSTGSLYDVNFFLVHWPTGWRMALEYNTDLFDRETAERMLSLWRSCFDTVLAHRQTRLSELPAPTQAGIATDSTRDSRTVAQPARLDASDRQATLARIWSELLGVPVADPEANFFELGGHSLLALRMLAKVDAAFGQRLTIARLFAHPTLAGFAGQIGGSTPVKPDWKIVRMQPHGAKTPVIAINNTVAYYNLAQRIGRDRPMIGIQMFNPEQPAALDDRSLESIAADYVDLIRAARSRGPYILMGHCVAGAIAFEAARQLRQAGEVVPLLVLCDSWRPGYLANLPAWPRALFQANYRRHVFKHHLAMRKAGETTWPEILATYPKIDRSGLLRLLAWLGLSGPEPLNRQDWGNRWFLPHLQKARDAYQAQPWDGTLALFKSDEMVTRFADPALGWSHLARGPLLVHDIPGWHTAMFQQEGAARMASHLRPLLDAVDAAARAA